MIRQGIIAYYGAFISDRVKVRRQLPVLNHAASKRMLRVAQALDSARRRCVILSSGLTPRIPTTWRKISQEAARVDGIAVLTIAQLGIRYLGFLLTPLTAVAAAVRLRRRHPIEMVVQYNYYPDALLFSLWCKMVYHAKVLLDLEDVAVPSLRDWVRGSEARPLNEVWCWFFMKMSITLSDLVFAPSYKLGCVVSNKDKFMAVTGCQKTCDIRLPAPTKEMREVCILMSGGIKFENGISVLAEGLKKADLRHPRSHLKIIVCGPGKYDWLRENIGELREISVEYRGFLTNAEFSEMYNGVDLCLALQKPDGRYGQYKAPSKGYEALCSGKALIVSDVGDFGLLPDDVCFKLVPYDSNRLADILVGLTPSVVAEKRVAAVAYAQKHFDCKKVGAKILGKLQELQEKAQ